MPAEGIPFRKIIEEMESRLIIRAVEVSGGVQKRAAELLQVKPTTLNEMIKRYGIPTRRTRFKGNVSEGRDTEVSDEVNGTAGSVSSEVVHAINEELRKQ